MAVRGLLSSSLSDKRGNQHEANDHRPGIRGQRRIGLRDHAGLRTDARAANRPSIPVFSAYTLVQECMQKSDNVAQGQCVGAVRGIVRGYQYGVLFLGQRSSLKSNEDTGSCRFV